MDSQLLTYMTGEEVHAGDRVQHKGSFATVVVVSDGEHEEFAPGYAEHAGAAPGIMLCDDDGATTSIGYPDEMLLFVERG